MVSVPMVWRIWFRLSSLHKLHWLIDTGLGRCMSMLRRKWPPVLPITAVGFLLLWGVSTFHGGQGLFRSLEINKRNLFEASAMFFLICAASELRVLSSSKAETTMMVAKRRASLRAPHQNPSRWQTAFASDNSVHWIGKAPPGRLIENCAKRRSTNCKLLRLNASFRTRENGEGDIRCINCRLC